MLLVWWYVLLYDLSNFCKEVFFTVAVTVGVWAPLLLLHLMDTHRDFLLQLELFTHLQLGLEGGLCRQLEAFLLLPPETLRKDSFSFPRQIKGLSFEPWFKISLPFPFLLILVSSVKLTSHVMLFIKPFWHLGPSDTSPNCEHWLLSKGCLSSETRHSPDYKGLNT